MNDQRLEIIQTVAAMFRAAPGAHYLNEFQDLINNTGISVESLVNILAQTDVFRQFLYSDALSNDAFASQFVENTVDSLASVESKAWAATEIARMLNAGQSRGEVIYWTAKALASVAADDIHWGAAAQQFNNKVAVASFYSIDQGGTAADLSVLQQVIAHVTDNAASAVAAQALLASDVSGKVIDGYIKGAHIFADLNGDGLLNPGEVSAMTDARGNYMLPAVTGFGQLVMSGGIDISTGTPFEGIMAAPAGSTVVNPLTTLIHVATKNSTLTVQDVAEKLLISLGLDKNVDLLHFDPIQEAIRTDRGAAATDSALAVHTATVQIQTLVSQAAALLDGAGIATDETAAIDRVYETLASSLGNNIGLVDLTSSDTIAQVIRHAAVSSGADNAVLLKAGVLLAGASQAIAHLNQAVADASASSTNKSKALSSIAAVQIVAENIEAAMKSGAAKGDVNGTVLNTTGSLLTKLIVAAGSKVGDVNGDGKPDAPPSRPPSAEEPPPPPPTTQYFLATNATSFFGTAAHDTLSISTAPAWTPLVMTAVILDGGAGTNTLSVQDGSNIAAATVINFPNLFFDATGVVGTNNVTMSASQHQNFTGTITAAGTGVNGEEITIVGDGAVTTLTNIENYSIGDDATDTRTVTISDAGMNVRANSASDAVTFNLGALAYTGTMTGENTSVDTLSLGTGADTSGGTITNVGALTLTSGASVRLSAAQNRNFTGTITAPGTGVNGEKIAVAGDGNVTTLANIETYELEDDSTNARAVTISTVGVNVTANSVSDAVTFNLGALAYIGTIVGENAVADTLSLGTGADISGGTITNVQALTLTSGASVRLSAAQNQNFTGTVIAPGAGVNGEEMTIAGDGAVTTLANIENYIIGDDTTNTRTVTISNAGANVTANSISDAVTFNLGALAYTGTIVGENTVVDTLSLSTGADISGGTITDVEALTLASGASVRLSAAQNQNFAGIVAAPGNGVNGEEITIAGDGNVTTLANIETYELEDDSTNARAVTVGYAGTNVTANSASDAITFNLGMLTYTGTITGENTITDTLNLGTGADVSGGTITNVQALTLASGASIRLSAAQNQSFTGNITAPGTGVNGETITIAGDGAITTLANIENYIIGDDSTNTRTVIITNAETNVTADSVSDAVIFNLGALIYTGAIIGETTVDDELNLLSLGTGADISGGTIINVEALALTSGASVRLSAAQNQNFTGTVTAPGSGVNGEEVIIAGDGAITTLANIENYVIGDDSANTRTVTITDAKTNVTANSASDAVTFNLGALAYTGTIIGESTVIDTLNLGTGADISGGTIVSVDELALAAGASVQLSVIQNQNFAGAITAPGTGMNGEKIIVSGNGAVAVLSNIETYELGDDTTNARTLTLGSDALTLIANHATDTITVNAAALAQNNALTLGTSASALVVSSLVGDIAASSLSGTLAVTTADAADNGISIVTGSAATSVNVAAGAASDTVNIDATALSNNTTLTVTSGAAAAGTVNIAGLTGNLAVSNPTSGTISVAVADNTADDGIAVAAGISNLAISDVADGDIVTVTGFTGSMLTGTIAGTTGKFNISTGTATNNIATAAGNDTFTFAAGTGLTGADVVDGGAGNDMVALTGNKAVAAASFNNVSNIEAITIANTTAHVAITAPDTLVAAGAVLTLQAASLTSGVLTFNGAAEADGAFNITSGGANDSITGGSGNDALAGGNGNDSIAAGLGNDVLSGDAGNDTLRFAAATGLTSADAVDGGAGMDTLALTGNMAFTAATDFDNVQNIEVITLGNTNTAVTITAQDTLVTAGATLTLSNATNSGVLTFNGSAEADGHFNITGGLGNDNIVSGSANNMLAGGAGDDTFTFVAGTGLTTDTVNGGSGTDTLALTGTAAITATQLNNVSNIEAITLSDMANTAVTITTVNALVATGATLTLSNAANSGVLTFNGAAETNGTFNITGGSGNDSITGGSKNDILTGGDGNDSLVGGLGNDVLFGGAGDDTFTFSAGTGLSSADVVDGGAGTDIVALTGNAAVVGATSFNNVRNIETITIANTTSAVAITTLDMLVTAGAVLTFQGTSLTSGVLTFNGAAESDGAFNITGGGANDNIIGGLGNDTLTGGNGNDSLTAGLGNDMLSGGAGNDTLRFTVVTGLTNADVVDGGTGIDTVALTGNSAFTAATDFDSVHNIEAITLGNTNTAVSITTQDTLVAAGATLTLSNAANSGVLTFDGSAEANGNFNLTGGSGNDNIMVGPGNDTVSGGTGNDTLIGGAGNDTMISGAGTDGITGGAGADTIILGSSASDNIRQTVVYSAASDGAEAGANIGADLITRFDANANNATDDLIQITGALKTAIDDDSDGTLDYSASDGAEGGNQAIAGGANQEATALADAEIELVLADFSAPGLANVVAELGEEIDFSSLATNEEHLFAVNFSATQTALLLYTAGSGGGDAIVASDIQVLGIIAHNDGSGLVAGNIAF